MSLRRAASFLGIFVLLLCLSSAIAHSHSHANSHSHSHSHAHDSKPKQKIVAPPKAELENSEHNSVSMDAIAATITIGVAPVLILPLIPSHSNEFLRVLLSFAAGGLLGDVFLHLLPHTLQSPQEDAGVHDHAAHVVPGLMILAGFFIFFFLEKMILPKSGHDHGHAHQDHPNSDKKHKEQSKESKQNQKNRASAYLNLIADTLHNFTDGLAIGASFLAGRSIGITTTIAVFFHEIPHELGDYAILIRSGFSRNQVLIAQLVTALGAVFGTMFSLFIARWAVDPSAWILPFTAGGFIYVAAAGVLPELLESSTTPGQSVLELLGFVAGVGGMYVIGLME